MKSIVSAALLSGLLAAGTASADPVSFPAMAGPLTNNSSPLSFDAGLGKVYVTGVVSGLAFYQSNATHVQQGDGSGEFDLDNAQVVLQKTDGFFQFYVQAGAYSMPSLGAFYDKTSHAVGDFFGAVPQAFVKLQLSDSFSVQAGKLPTLIGAEYTFTFENMNIERGVLWNQENAVNRGAQVNYSSGPLTVSVSLNDGFYSNRYNWLSGLVSYAFDSSNSLAIVGMGNLGTTHYGSLTTPLAQNNGEIFNLIYTHSSAPWVISPYLQYTRVKANASLGFLDSNSTLGLGLLANYNLSPAWNIAGRVEYQKEGGSALSPTLSYGPHSKAWSVTITPTWQNKLFYVRPELSYVALSDNAFGFGKTGTKSDQFRAMLETGIVF